MPDSTKVAEDALSNRQRQIDDAVGAANGSNAERDTPPSEAKPPSKAHKEEVGMGTPQDNSVDAAKLRMLRAQRKQLKGFPKAIAKVDAEIAVILAKPAE